MEDQGRGGGGEVRRIHIIYFLSRMGRIEHPHLIRVHHLSKNGVHLRDVKRWLSELRGKDMPDSFAWSYKRKYKTGYVWQDLLDDDLISPISDNEFVLKGSEISSFSFDLFSRDEEIKKRSNLKTEEVIKKEEEKNPDLLKMNNEDSGPLDSETSTVSDDKEEKQLNIRTTKEIEEKEEMGGDQNENSMEKSEKEKIEEESIKISSSSSSSFKKSKSYSSGATNVLRNLLNCRAVDTDDSATMLINKNNNNNSSQICKFDIFGGSERISSSNGIWNHQSSYQTRRDEKSRKKSSEFGNQKKVSAAFKPVAEPHCSQCGKGFKPEKLHSHMKSCKGLKNFTKNGGAAAGIGFAHQK